MAAIFVLILVSVFHGFASGYPSQGMLNFINIIFLLFFCFSLYYSMELTTESQATLARDYVL